jgi:hypothetical protein
MFGHGQVEGFREKYGMEYRAARWHETPSEHLALRHEREIFPILHRRALFANVENFALFDLYREDGSVDENVFAFSNFQSGERALVVFNNSNHHTRGWVKTSAAFFDKGRGELRQQSLQEALRLSGEADKYLRARDLSTGWEYLLSSREVCERGLLLQLAPYERRTWVDVEEFWDEDGRWAALCHELAGTAVPDLDRALRERELSPVLEPFGRWFDAKLLKKLMPTPHFSIAPATIAPVDLGVPSEAAAPALKEAEALDFEALDDWEGRARAFFEALGEHAEMKGAPAELARAARERLVRLLEMHSSSQREDGAAPFWARTRLDDCASWCLLMAWCALRDVPTALASAPGSEQVLAQGGEQVLASGSAQEDTWFVDKWVLGGRIESAWSDVGLAEGSGAHLLASLRAIFECKQAFTPDVLSAEGAAWKQVFSNASAARVLGVNRHEGRLWFNRESWEEWSARAAIAALVEDEPTPNAQVRSFARWEAARDEAARAAFNVEVFVAEDDATLEDAPQAAEIAERF